MQKYSKFLSSIQTETIYNLKTESFGIYDLKNVSYLQRPKVRNSLLKWFLNLNRFNVIIVRDLVMEWKLSSSFCLLRKMLRKEKSYERNLGRHKVGETHYFYYNFISENIQSTILKQSSFLTSFPKTFTQLSNYQCLFPNFDLQSPVRDQDCLSPWTA